MRGKGLSCKLEFIVPSERWHSANARENGLPHQPEGWFAMTSFFVFSLFYRSVTLQRYVIANQCAHWCGNPSLAMRSGRRPIPLGAKNPIYPDSCVKPIHIKWKMISEGNTSILHFAFSIPPIRMSCSARDLKKM